MGILKDLEEQIQSVNPYFEYRPSQDEGSEMVYSMVQSDDGGVVPGAVEEHAGGPFSLPLVGRDRR